MSEGGSNLPPVQEEIPAKCFHPTCEFEEFQNPISRSRSRIDSKRSCDNTQNGSPSGRVLRRWLMPNSMLSLASSIVNGSDEEAEHLLAEENTATGRRK